MLIGWPGGDWQATLRLAGLLVGGYLFVLWLATILWVYRDTQARTRDPVAQVLGIALIVGFPLLGVPIYLIVRPRETLAESYERYLDREALFALVRGDERGVPAAIDRPPDQPVRRTGSARQRLQQRDAEPAPGRQASRRATDTYTDLEPHEQRPGGRPAGNAEPRGARGGDWPASR